MNELLTYVIMVDSLIVTYIWFVIVLIELQNVVSQELKCLCSKTTTVLSKWTIPKTSVVSLDIFIVLEMNEWINKLYINSCILYRSVYVLYIQYICTLQVHISTTCSIVIHYIGCGSQSPNLQEILCFIFGILYLICTISICATFFRNLSLV